MGSGDKALTVAFWSGLGLAGAGLLGVSIWLMCCYEYEKPVNNKGKIEYNSQDLDNSSGGATKRRKSIRKRKTKNKNSKK
jgi:hypothetical protein